MIELFDCTLQVDAISYFEKQIAALKCKIDAERSRAYRHKLGIAFVTFARRQHAIYVLEDMTGPCTTLHTRQQAQQQAQQQQQQPQHPQALGGVSFTWVACPDEVRDVTRLARRRSSREQALQVPRWSLRFAPAPGTPHTRLLHYPRHYEEVLLPQNWEKLY